MAKKMPMAQKTASKTTQNPNSFTRVDPSGGTRRAAPRPNSATGRFVEEAKSRYQKEYGSKAKIQNKDIQVHDAFDGGNSGTSLTDKTYKKLNASRGKKK